MIKQKETKRKKQEQAKSSFMQVFCGLQLYRRQRTYRRIFTPLVMIWCLIYQRMHSKHTCDAVVSELRTGAMDHLEQAPQKLPLSQRIRSESTAGFCKARQRLPFAVLEQALDQTVAYAERIECRTQDWLDRGVQVLDGSTVQLRPFPDLVRQYGIHKTAKQVQYWVILRIVCLFCLHNGLVSRCREGSIHVSEPALAVDCLAGLYPGDICLADRMFGIFQVVQAVRQAGGEVLFRLSRKRAHKLYKQQCYPGQDLDVVWSPSAKDHLHPGMSAAPVAGRLIYVRLERPGFRSQDLFLFTTLLDRQRFTRDRLVQLYSWRWQAELDLRFLKDNLDLHRLEGKTVDVVRKELWAGILAYNLVRIFQLQAAHLGRFSPLQLSFSQARQRVFDFVFHEFPLLSDPHRRCLDLLHQISRCCLPKRPALRIEPRWVRPLDRSFPAFWIERPLARQKFLLKRLALAVY